MMPFPLGLWRLFHHGGEFAFALHDGGEGAGFMDIENDDWQIVLTRQADSGGIHHGQITRQHIKIGQRFVALGIGLLARIGGVDAIHLRALEERIAIHLSRAQGGCRIGGEEGVARAGGENHHAALFHVSFGAAANEVSRAAALLTGQDIFAVERHLKHGLLDWPSVEEAMWDAIGKIAGQPLCRLMGGASLDTVPVYFTYVWPIPQDEVLPKAHGDQAGLVRQAGFKAMKIQMFPDIDLPMVTVNATLLGAAPEQMEVEVARKIENESNVRHRKDNASNNITTRCLV